MITVETSLRKYSFRKLFTRGGFSKVYVDDDETVVLKVDDILDSDAIPKEVAIYKYLEKQASMSVINIAKLHWNGTLSSGNQAVILERVGVSLDTLYDMNNGIWSYSTFHYVSSCLLKQIGLLHSNGIVHGDIKPDNFSLLGDTFYLLDFGLASFFLENEKHVPFHESQKWIIGTVRYASLFNHSGIRYARRDDLESFVYMMIYFFFRQVPWQTPPEDVEEVKRSKEAYTHQMLSKMGPIWVLFYKTIRDLAFEETIDYNLWTDLFLRESTRDIFGNSQVAIHKDLFLPIRQSDGKDGSQDDRNNQGMQDTKDVPITYQKTKKNTQKHIIHTKGTTTVLQID